MSGIDAGILRVEATKANDMGNYDKTEQGGGRNQSAARHAKARLPLVFCFNQLICLSIYPIRIATPIHIMAHQAIA